MTSRRQLRAGSDQWWKVVAHSDGDAATKVDERHQAYVKGPINDIIVVSLPPMPPDQYAKLAEDIRGALAAAGQHQHVVVVSDSIQFMRFRPVDQITARKLNRIVMHDHVRAGVHAKKLDS